MIPLMEVHLGFRMCFRESKPVLMESYYAIEFKEATKILIGFRINPCFFKMGEYPNELSL